MAESAATAARAELARRELARRQSAAPPATTAPPINAQGVMASPFAGYDPSVRNAGNPAERAELAASAGRQVSETVQAIPAAINRGVADLAGLPMDTITSAADLLGMGYGLIESKVRGRPANEFFTPFDRSQVIGTGDWNARMLDAGPTAVAGAPVTPNPFPENPAARTVYAAGRNIPGAVTGRMVLGGAAGGAGSQLVAEAGGDPGMQAAAGLIGGRVAETAGVRPPLRAQDPAQPGSFGRDSASAAAATPDLQNVPAELRQPLVTAFQRGDRDMVERVVRAETLPVPIRLMEGQARGDSQLMADEFNLRGTDKNLAARFDEQNQALIENLDTIRREASPNVVANDHVQNGQALIDSYKAYDEPVRAEITAAYQALEDANGGRLPINGKSFVDAADAALERKLATDDLPPQIRSKLEKVRKQGGMLTFEQFESLRTDLATAARDADRGTLGGGGNAAKAIRVVRDELENMPIEGAGVEVKALADRARALARERFERMRQDPAYEAAVVDPAPAGGRSPFADNFVKKHVIGGKSANLQRMREPHANDPTAGETIAAAALNYVKSKSGVNLYTNEGNFTQAGFNRALADLRPRLRSLVSGDVADVLEQLGAVAQDLQRQRKGGAFNNSGTFSAAAREASKGYIEGVANTVVPGANLGTFVRNRRAATREKDRAARALDPTRYLTEDAE